MDLRRSLNKETRAVDDCAVDDACHLEVRNCRLEGMGSLLRAPTLGDRVFHDVLWFNSVAVGHALWPTRCVFRDLRIHGLKRALRFVVCGLQRVRFTGRTGPFEVHGEEITSGVRPRRAEDAKRVTEFYDAVSDWAIDLTEATLDGAPLIAGVPFELLRGVPERDAWIAAETVAGLDVAALGSGLLPVTIERGQQMNSSVTVHAVGDQVDRVRDLVADGTARWLRPIAANELSGP